MERNVGELDRVARIGLGSVAVFAGVVVLAVLEATIAGALALLIGAVLLVTGATERCGLYAALGTNTCERPASRNE